MANQTSVDYAFLADLDESAVLKALDNIDKQAKELAKTMDASFKNIQRNGATSFKQLEVFARVALRNINAELSTLAQNTATAVNIPQITQDQQALQLQQEEIKLEQEKIVLQRQELALQNELTAAKERSKIAAEQSIQTEISRYPQLSAALNKLAAEYGNFSVALGKNESELNKEEKEVIDLINRYPQLAGKIDQLTKEYGELNLQVKNTEKANKSTGKSALGFAAQLTGIASASYLVTNALRNMARTGVESFKELIANSIVTAQQFDLVHKSIQGILGTDDLGRVERLFTSIREQSRQLGTNVASIANAFLPLLDSTAQLDKAGELVQELIQLSIVGGRRQSQGDAIRALAEGFSGDFVSLRRLFELTPGEIDKIRDTYRELGTEGFLDALDEVLAKRGIVLSEFQKTTVFRFQQIQEAARDVQNALGQPIDEAIFNFLDRLGNFITDNFDDILALSNAIGMLIGNLIQDVGDTILTTLEKTDFDQLFQDIKNFNSALQDTQPILENLFKQLKYVYDAAEYLFVELPNKSGKLGNSLSKLVFGDRANDEIIGVGESWRIFFGWIEEGFNNFHANVAGYGAAISTIASLSDDLIKGNISLEEFGNKIEEAANIARNDVKTSFEEGKKAVEEFNQAVDAGRNANPQGQTALDDIEYQLYRLPEQLKELYSQIQELQKPINEARLELEVEFQRKQLEIQKDYIDKQFDLELDASRDREDIETDFLRKLEDATRDANEKRNKINTDYNRELEDINRDFDTNLQDLAKESANKRIDIEKDLQSKLAELRRQFLFDAEEAIRQNDAVAFLRLQRKYQFEIEEAKAKAEEDRQNAVDEEKKKREELQAERDAELEKARIDRARDLEDYKQSVANQLDEIRRARDRDLADQSLAERRKYEDLNLWLERQTEALNQYYDQKQEDIERQYAEELAKIAELNAKRLELENRGLVLSLKQQEAYYRQRQILADKYAQQWLATSGYGGFNPSNGSAGNQGGNPTGGDSGSTPPSGAATEAYNIGLSIKRLAAQKNKLTAELTKQVDELVEAVKVNELLALFEEIKAMELGGSFRANQPMLVGEKRPEIVSFNKAGTVYPSIDSYVGEMLGSYLSRNQTSNLLPSPGTSVDNSRNYNVDLSMLDPNHLSPGQIAIIIEVAKQIIFQAMPA